MKAAAFTCGWYGQRDISCMLYSWISFADNFFLKGDKSLMHIAFLKIWSDNPYVYIIWELVFIDKLLGIELLIKLSN